jgi:hypothetical protein
MLRARCVPDVVMCPPVAASPAPAGRRARRLAQIRLECRRSPPSLRHRRVSSGVKLIQIRPSSLGPICSLASPRRVLLKLLRLGPVLSHLGPIPESSLPAAQACSSLPKSDRIALPWPRSSLTGPL